MKSETTRRELLRYGGLLLASGPLVTVMAHASPQEKEGAEPEVTATEDLMRAHGDFRRALLVYSQIAV